MVIRKSSIAVISICVYILSVIYSDNIYAIHSQKKHVISSNIQKEGQVESSIEKVSQCIVNISVKKQIQFIDPMNPNQGRGELMEVGSGVIIDAGNGYIVTNAHVIKDAKNVSITLYDGRRSIARVIGIDTVSDVAVIKTELQGLEQIRIGESDDLYVGEKVYAIGSPFGLQQTVTSGIISNIGRSNIGIEGIENFIQTDAPINPGNSGGALVKENGELIGINTAIITPVQYGGNIGIGFAIPINMVNMVTPQIIKYGNVKRGGIGIIIQDSTKVLADAMNLCQHKGVIVAKVLHGSPADLSGIKPGDLIVEIEDKKINSVAQAGIHISLLRAGTNIKIRIIRKDKQLNMYVNTEDAEQLDSKMKKMQESGLLSGIMMRNFQQLENGNTTHGIEIVDIDESSIAYTCGLRGGDVILSIDEKPIKNIEDITSTLRDKQRALFNIKRGINNTLFVVLYSK